MKKLLLILICLTGNILNLNAQMFTQETSSPLFVPPSPTAASLAMFVDYPVSHYTGVPNISIPIYEVKVDDFIMPINLSYHSSGIRVSQEASWVGLGWALKVGGSISRTVKCIDDFSEFNNNVGMIATGYYKAPETWDVNGHLKLMYYNNSFSTYYTLIADPEPDIFYFNLPNISGKFLINKKDGIILFDKTMNIKIEIVYTYLNGYCFKITTPDGIQYEFDRREKTMSGAREGSLKNKTIDIENINSYFDNQEYTSTWYLNKIILTNQKVINFSYADEKYYPPVQESCLVNNRIGESGDDSKYAEYLPKSGPNNSLNKHIVEALRLTKISWDNGYIDFISSKRLDVRPKDYGPNKLDEIKVYNNISGLIKNFKFTYSYFDNPNNTNANNEYNTDKEYLYKRLKLDAVTEIGVGNYTMFYNSGSLPAKNSTNTDYWGYHNGRDYGEKFYTLLNYKSKWYDGVEKLSNLNYLEIGVLNQINFPTGGYNKFYYQENTFENDALSSLIKTTISQRTGGGLRIYKIESGGNNITPKYRNFEYWGGKAVSPQCLFYEYDFHWKFIEREQYVGGGYVYYDGIVNYIVQTSNSTIPFTSLRNGNVVGYDRVEESITEGQNTQIVEYTFHNMVEQPNTNMSPFVSNDINFFNGLPKSVTYFYINNTGGNNNKFETKKIIYEYKINPDCPDYYVRGFHFLGDHSMPYYVDYEYCIEWINKVSETTFTSSKTEGSSSYSPTSKIIEDKYFTYNSKNWQVNHMRINSNRVSYENIRYFPQDFSDDISKKMVEKHMINIPLEDIKLKGGKVIAGEKTAYRYEPKSDMYLPDVMYKLNSTNNLNLQNYRDYYYPKVYFEKYNSKGKYTQVRTDECTTVYLWGYKNQYVIAEIKNATLSQINSIISESKQEEIANKEQPAIEDWDLIRGLRNHSALTKSMVTAFKYKDMVGVTEITDPSGRTVYYEYDSLGRLVWILDDSRKPIESYNYHYKGQQ